MTCLNQAITNILAKIDNPRDPPVAYILGSKRIWKLKNVRFYLLKKIIFSQNLSFNIFILIHQNNYDSFWNNSKVFKSSGNKSKKSLRPPANQTVEAKNLKNRYIHKYLNKVTCLNQAITNILAKINNPRDPPVAYILGSKRIRKLKDVRFYLLKKRIFSQNLRFNIFVLFR